MKVLVVGSGGREHALAWKIQQSPLVDRVFVAPGNPGTEQVAEDVAISSDDLEGLVKFACDESIDLTVVGPEAPLCAGIVDLFREQHPERRAYSWWDYRGGAFHKGEGLRIDFLLGTRALLGRVRDVSIDRDYRKKKEGLTASDHAPVIASFA